MLFVGMPRQAIRTKCLNDRFCPSPPGIFTWIIPAIFSGCPDGQCVLGWSEIFPSLTCIFFHTVEGGALDAPLSQNSVLIAGRHECRPLLILWMFFHLPYHKIFLSSGDALRERFLREGACPCGSKDATPLLSRILWVLSWRSKKVPSHA